MSLPPDAVTWEELAGQSVSGLGVPPQSFDPPSPLERNHAWPAASASSNAASSFAMEESGVSPTHNPQEEVTTLMSVAWSAMYWYIVVKESTSRLLIM